MSFHSVKTKQISRARSITQVLTLAILVLFCGAGVGVKNLPAQERARAKQAPSLKISQGKQAFTTDCAGCHGLDGRGGERAPSIVSSAKVRRGSDAQLSRIISDGIAGTGMPAFRSLNPAQIASLVAFVRFLQGDTANTALPGDPESGKRVFFGKGECSACHTIAGEGGFMGPDLSAYGTAIPAKTILDAIVSSTRIVPVGYRSAVLTTNDGARLEGIVRNEDNFSLQLQTKDGNFHFIQKSDLKNVEYSGKSAMPADYGERLSSSELNDLASFLMTAGASSRAAVPPKPARGTKR